MRQHVQQCPYEIQDAVDCKEDLRPPVVTRSNDSVLQDISNTYLPGPEYKHMKSNDIMTSIAGGIMRAVNCPTVKPTQRRFGVSDRQTSLGWFIGMKE